MNYRWLMKASMWVRNPPSEKKVMLVVGIIALCLVIAFVEHYIGWPDWAQRERVPRLPR